MSDALHRAREMLYVASKYIQDHCPDQIIEYDGAECDGLCVSDDCEMASEDLRLALTLTAERDALAAEVERLREALDDIGLTCERQGNGHLYNDTAGGWEQAMDDVASVARAALEEGKGG